MLFRKEYYPKYPAAFAIVPLLKDLLRLIAVYSPSSVFQREQIIENSPHYKIKEIRGGKGELYINNESFSKLEIRFRSPEFEFYILNEWTSELPNWKFILEVTDPKGEMDKILDRYITKHIAEAEKFHVDREKYRIKQEGIDRQIDWENNFTRMANAFPSGISKQTREDHILYVNNTESEFHRIQICENYLIFDGHQKEKVGNSEYGFIHSFEIFLKPSQYQGPVSIHFNLATSDEIRKEIISRAKQDAGLLPPDNQTVFSKEDGIHISQLKILLDGIEIITFSRESQERIGHTIISAHGNLFTTDINWEGYGPKCKEAVALMKRNFTLRNLLIENEGRRTPRYEMYNPPEVHQITVKENFIELGGYTASNPKYSGGQWKVSLKDFAKGKDHDFVRRNFGESVIEQILANVEQKLKSNEK